MGEDRVEDAWQDQLNHWSSFRLYMERETKGRRDRRTSDEKWGTMQADELSLIQQIARGDAQAMRQLYTSYRPLLWRYLWQQLEGDEQAVEDALQEIFLSIWRFAQGFRGEAQVKTWIFRIAHHCVAHSRRKTIRCPELVLTPRERDEQSESATGSTPFAQTSYASHENEVVERMTLDTAISRLSAKHREALELVFQQGFTLDEAAHILDVPTGTVKSRISYARRALQRELACLEAVEEHLSDS